MDSKTMKNCPLTYWMVIWTVLSKGLKKSRKNCLKICQYGHKNILYNFVVVAVVATYLSLAVLKNLLHWVSRTIC